jgi:hypothetical protein
VREADCSTAERVIKDTILPTATRRPTWMALVALVGVFLLAFSSDPAEAATTFTVNRTGDASDRDITNARCDTSANRGNQCTLRAAIEEANDTSGEDTIRFQIGDTDSVKTISPDSRLPVVTDTVTIDGYTQTGASENTLEEGTDAVFKVQLKGSDAGAFETGLRIEAADSTIRGLAINRFHVGVNIVGIGGENGGNRVEGNFIGTNAAGTADRGNGIIGVSIGTPDNTVGGTEPARRNLISGNDGDGIVLAGANNTVQGNLIGTRADGSGDLGNDGDGVHISILGNTVGGLESGAANTISRNGGSGVLLGISTATGNSVLSNSIFANGGLGIDLNNDGVTPNDTDDPDTGENNLQNFPVIDSATWNSTTDLTTITGTLNSNPSQDFRIQCFLTGNQPDASGHGEGELLLDTTTRSTDSAGDATFQCDTQEAVAGREVAATATNISTGDTSEFSANKEVFAIFPSP